MTALSTDFTDDLELPTFMFDETPDECQPTSGKIALIGPCPTRACGLATFTSDIVSHAGSCGSIFNVDHICVLREGESSQNRIAFVEADQASYHSAARAINEAQYDAVWIQHEFGIFGGDDGQYIIGLAERLAAPVIVTFHTILPHPSASQFAIIERLIGIASRIMVMSVHGRDLLVSRYKADPHRISVIEHGAPDRPLSGKDPSAPLTLATFGLLGPGKGLETALDALAKVRDQYPDFRYRIIGATHPNLIAQNGEAYRDALKARASSLALESHVEWVDKFLDIDDLLTELDQCQIYLTPYPNLNQSTSGTLSYAVALGKAVISTPYIHACELLADGCGTLFNPGDSDALASAILELALDPDKLQDVQRRAYRRGRSTIWPEFVAGVDDMIGSTILHPQPKLAKDAMLTVPSLIGFKAMVDGTGMLQHSHGPVPNRAHGYCVDDNARALMLMNHVSNRSEPSAYHLALTFCSFIQDSYNPDTRRFRNFMGYDRRWLEEVGSEDSNGRTIWSLGHTARHNPHQDIRWWASDFFNRTIGLVSEMGSPRAHAFAALGAADIIENDPENIAAQHVIAHTGEMLFRLLKASSRPDWTWFETVLAYDNPRLPEALMKAGKITGRLDWLDTGIDALRWINQQQISERSMFRPIGSEGFGRQGDFLPFDQQPLEAWSAVDACAAANDMHPSPEWLAHAEQAMSWFHGNNDRHQPLIDAVTGSCRDGITPHGINQNRGAESILAYQLAYQGYMQLIARRGRGASINDDKLYRAAKPAGYSRPETGRRPTPGRIAPISSQLAG